ncbi:MAG: hypothetical protein ACLP70_12985 [Streptosporangiaceae bacterium]
MATRRGRGDGGLYWDKSRQRWIAEVTVGYSPGGRRIVRKASGKSKTAAQKKLKEIIRDREDGLAIAPHNYTVADAVREWLDSASAAVPPRPLISAPSWPTRGGTTIYRKQIRPVLPDGAHVTDRIFPEQPGRPAQGARDSLPVLAAGRGRSCTSLYPTWV